MNDNYGRVVSLLHQLTEAVEELMPTPRVPLKGYSSAVEGYGRNALDLTGQQFGNLIAVEPVGRNRIGAIVWKCICNDCGYESEHVGSYLKTGDVTSCWICRKGKIERIADTVEQFLEGLDMSVERISTNKIKKELNLQDEVSQTFSCALRKVLNKTCGWTLEGRSMVRIFSLEFKSLILLSEYSALKFITKGSLKRKPYWKD